MSLPSNFGLLALSPTIRTNDAFLFLQTGVNGYIDMFIQSATGSPVNVMTITSGVSVASRVFVNANGNDSTAQRENLSLPFATIDAAISAASIGDTIDIYPGTYYVTGNLFKDTVSLNFYRGSVVFLQNSGKLHVPSLLSDYNIYGNFTLANDGTQANPVQILGSCGIEFYSIDCGTGNLLVSGSNASVFFKGLGIDNSTDGTRYSTIYAGKLVLDNPYSVIFENVKTAPTYGIECKTGSSTPTLFRLKNSYLESDRIISETCGVTLTGRILAENSTFIYGYYSVTTPSGYISEFNNCRIAGGLICSGTNYYNNVVFDTQNVNYYPRNCIINNRGGYSLFSNCAVRNNNNSAYISGTYIASGSASGAANFNILGSMVSFKPTGAGTTVQFGTFTHNSAFK